MKYIVIVSWWPAIGGGQKARENGNFVVQLPGSSVS